MRQAAETSGVQRGDKQLLANFLERRDQAAFAEIVRRHGGMVMAVCRSIVGNAEDAKDAAQAVFLTLAQKPPSRWSSSSLAPWLHKVAWYVAMRAAQAGKVRRRYEQEAVRMKQDWASDRELPVAGDVLHAELSQLPQKYRLALLLHDMEGRSQEETAALLECGVSAAAMRISRGRQMLGDRLRKRGIIATAVGLTLALAGHASAGVSPAFVATITGTACAAIAGTATSAIGTSGTILALSKGAAQMLFWAKMKTVAIVVMATLFVGGAVGTYVTVAAEPSTPKPYLFGTITAIGTDSVTIKSGADSEVTVTVDALTVYKVADKAGSLADLKVGMHAGVYGQPDKPATQIFAYMPKPTPPPPTPTSTPVTTPKPYLFGTITAVGTDSVSIKSGTDSSVVTVAVDASTTYKVNQKDGSLADLKEGMHAGAFGQPGKPATQIFAYMPKPTPPPPTPTSTPVTTPKPYLFGTITAIGTNSVSIKPGTDNAVVTVAVDASTTYKVNQKDGSLADLKVGMHAGALGQPGKPATQIFAYMPKTTTAGPAAPATSSPASTPKPYLFGTIAEVGTDSVTIKSGSNSSVVKVDGSTVYKIAGKDGSMADLKVGMHAAAFGQPGKPAGEIYAYMPNVAETPTSSTSTKPYVFGTITNIGTNTITLKSGTNSSVVIVAVDGSTVYKVNGKDGWLADLKVGMHAGASGQSGKPATLIYAYMPTKK